jgi:hypothetical protein
MAYGKDNGLLFLFPQGIGGNDGSGHTGTCPGMIRLGRVDIVQQSGNLGQQRPLPYLCRIPSPPFHKHEGACVNGHLLGMLDTMIIIFTKIGEHVPLAAVHKGVGEEKGFAGVVKLLEIPIKGDTAA